jgi:photosynthetic reaction center H subunit
MAAEHSGDRLVPIDKMSDFRVAEGDPDVRGWNVIGSDGTKVGKVDNLLVDREAMKVRYLDVDVDDDLVRTDRDHHILVPIGHARLERDEKRIVVGGIESGDLAALPEYTHEPLTPEYETSIRRRFDQQYQAESESDFYNDPLYDDRRFYGTGRENPLA